MSDQLLSELEQEVQVLLDELKAQQKKYSLLEQREQVSERARYCLLFFQS